MYISPAVRYSKRGCSLTMLTGRGRSSSPLVGTGSTVNNVVFCHLHCEKATKFGKNLSHRFDVHSVAFSHYLNFTSSMSANKNASKPCHQIAHSNADGFFIRLKILARETIFGKTPPSDPELAKNYLRMYANK